MEQIKELLISLSKNATAEYFELVNQSSYRWCPVWDKLFKYVSAYK